MGVSVERYAMSCSVLAAAPQHKDVSEPPDHPQAFICCSHPLDLGLWAEFCSGQGGEEDVRLHTHCVTPLCPHQGNVGSRLLIQEENLDASGLAQEMPF